MVPVPSHPHYSEDMVREYEENLRDQAVEKARQRRNQRKERNYDIARRMV